jgi:CDP-diglyceride synthetase
LLRALGEVYRKGGALPFAAPAIFALAVAPEAVQHAAEIELGMFASREAFIAKSNDPARMIFGGIKVAGLVVCILLTARFWHCGTLGRALRMPARDLGRTLLAIVLSLAASLPAEWAAQSGQPPQIYWPMVAASWLLSFLTLAYLLGALLGDRQMTLRTSFTSSWKLLPTLALLTVAAFWPASTLHSYAHKLALGLDPVLVWTIMAADSLLVGLLAALLGSALAVSYRLGGGGQAKAP